MNSRFWRTIKLFARRLWVKVALFGLVALLTPVLSDWLSPFVPDRAFLDAVAKPTEELLGILTSSMLVVTTFSISIAVASFTSAANSSSPRATVLLEEDHTTQTVLAIFIGAFVFGLVSLIAFHAGLFSRSDQLILFAVTVLVTAIVVVSLMRWINHLMRFGQLHDTLDRIKAATKASLTARLQAPILGGQPLTGELPGHARPIASPRSGVIQHVDMPGLQAIAAENGLQLYMTRVPGEWIVEGQPLCYASGRDIPDETACRIAGALLLGAERTFDDDPLFGLLVLAEIGSRALSPGINDSGTAVDVIRRQTRLLSIWPKFSGHSVTFENVHVRPILAEEAVNQAYRRLARDGAGVLEVQAELQNAMNGLGELAPETFGQATRDMSEYALLQARESGMLEADLDRLTKTVRNGDFERSLDVPPAQSDRTI